MRMVENSYINSTCSICDDYSVNASDIWMNVDSGGTNFTKRSPTKNITLLDNLSI